MRTRARGSRLPSVALLASLLAASALPRAGWAWTPVPVVNDALTRMPGTQPAQGVGLQPSEACQACHAGPDPALAASFLWKGTMMAQAGRDPFFWPALTVAAQDSVYAFGRPNAADGCVRCHFPTALATGFGKDNRIPPRGFRVAEAAARQAEPAWAGAAAPGYFSAAEYSGGFDDVALALPPGGSRVEVRLYYQTTSREYVEFLRDEINGTGKTALLSPTPSGEPMAHIVKTDPFFAQLAAWGDTAYQLWIHVKDVPGAAPILMT